MNRAACAVGAGLLGAVGCGEPEPAHPRDVAGPSEDNAVEVSLLRTPGLSPPAAAQVFARFAALTSAAEPAFPEPSPDACAGVVYALDEVAPAAETLRSAGGLTFGGAVRIGPLAPDPELDGAYFASLDPAVFAFGETVDVSATGGAFPAFEGELALPSDTALEAPATGFSAEDGLALAWSGAAAALPVTAVFGAAWGQDRWVLRCDAEDDGVFEVPDGAFDGWPQGADVSLRFSRVVSSDLEVDGRPLALRGVVGTLVGGTVP